MHAEVSGMELEGHGCDCRPGRRRLRNVRFRPVFVSGSLRGCESLGLAPGLCLEADLRVAE